ncbi:MAG: hypothetical protein V1808_01130 [Candidatus Daviesbacteria bacterium]
MFDETLENIKTKERVDFLEKLKKDAESYDISLFHGSNSASLIGVTRAKGLLPAGQMVSEDSNAVPFSGELDKGIEENGVNREAISFTKDFPHVAIEYSGLHEYKRAQRGYRAKNEFSNFGFNINGWNLAKGQLELEKLNQQLRGSKYDDPDFVRYRASIETRITLEKKRLAIWPTLSLKEQNFIEDPFSILYGINFANFQKISNKLHKIPQGSASEYYVQGKVDESVMTILCPGEKMDVVKKYLLDNGIKMPVLSLEILDFLITEFTYWIGKNSGKSMWSNFGSLHDYISALIKWRDTELAST